VVLTADSGFHSEESVKGVLDREVDAYVADNKFRLRDLRFATLQKHRGKTTDRSQTSRARKYFGPADFPFDESSGVVVCPAGHPMKCSCRNFKTGPNGFRGSFYKADPAHCAGCPLRPRCIRNPTTKARQMAKLEKGIRGDTQSYTQKMIERFDCSRGRYYYSRRMGTVEPVFANIRSTLDLDRFTLRGRRKVGIQWMLFCMVHNLGKPETAASLKPLRIPKRGVLPSRRRASLWRKSGSTADSVPAMAPCYRGKQDRLQKRKPRTGQ